VYVDTWALARRTLAHIIIITQLEVSPTTTTLPLSPSTTESSAPHHHVANDQVRDMSGPALDVDDDDVRLRPRPRRVDLAEGGRADDARRRAIVVADGHPPRMCPRRRIPPCGERRGGCDNVVDVVDVVVDLRPSVRGDP